MILNIYVLDKSLNIIDIIDTYTSIIWTNRYYECGDFELYTLATPHLIEILKEDYYLIRETHENNAMVIESISITTDAENGNYITVKGRCLKSIVYRRIIWNQTNVSGKIGKCIERLLNENVISPIDENRRIPNFQILSLLDTTDNIDTQYTGDNLGETITSICKSYGLGWNIELDLDEKKFYFVLYVGTNRSYEQTVNPWVVFSNEFENLLSTNYTFDKRNYSNVAKIAGEGEGTQRKFTTLGSATGINRYESFVDAKDLSTNEGEITDEEYFIQLEERGKEKLAERTTTENFEGETIDYRNVFGKDYFLGDVVEVVNEYGMEAVTRVIEVIESEDESGKYTIPTFSSYLNNSADESAH